MKEGHYPDSAVERAMKIQEVILRAMSKEISWLEAAEICRMSARQLRRWKRRYERQGYDGLFDRRLRRPSPQRMPMKKAEQILQLYRERYGTFNVAHFHEKLKEEHGIDVSYSWVKAALQGAGLVKKQKKNVPHRRKRERRPLVGMMIHLDGSEHPWFGDAHPDCTLLVCMDDATSEIYAARFVPAEDTRSVMGILREVMEAKGLFCSLYTDRASHFVFTPKEGEKPDRNFKTQVERALDQLGIELIVAYSPQARGRGERLFGTWQGRLPQELMLAGITTMEEGNRYLEDVFIPWHNRKLTVKAQEKGSAFVPLFGKKLDSILCLHHPRTVQADNTVRVANLVLQIPKSRFRCSFAKCKVTVFEHLEGTFSIGYGPHVLGTYHPNGTLLEAPERRRRAA